jgi:hypothetical protein
MFPTCHTKEKEVRKKQRRHTTKDVRLPKINDGLWGGPIHGTTGSGNCLQGMKRRLRTTLAWCNCHAVSSFTER